MVLIHVGHHIHYGSLPWVFGILVPLVDFLLSDALGRVVQGIKIWEDVEGDMIVKILCQSLLGHMGHVEENDVLLEYIWPPPWSRASISMSSETLFLSPYRKKWDGITWLLLITIPRIITDNINFVSSTLSHWLFLLFTWPLLRIRLSPNCCSWWLLLQSQFTFSYMKLEDANNYALGTYEREMGKLKFDTYCVTLH